MGVAAAEAAASWIDTYDGAPVPIRRVLAMMDDGDPRVDDYLPARPNLSGEWADGLTPHSLALSIFGSADDDPFDNEDVEALADAYEAGVLDTFEAECERILRAALGEGSFDSWPTAS
jgi:hypothetical protein